MQRRSARSSSSKDSPEEESESLEPSPPPAKTPGKRGRPPKDKSKPEEDNDPPLPKLTLFDANSPSNPQGRPVRQRKKNRFYFGDEHDIKTGDTSGSDHETQTQLNPLAMLSNKNPTLKTNKPKRGRPFSKNLPIVAIKSKVDDIPPVPSVLPPTDLSDIDNEPTLRLVENSPDDSSKYDSDCKVVYDDAAGSEKKIKKRKLSNVLELPRPVLNPKMPLIKVEPLEIIVDSKGNTLNVSHASEGEEEELKVLKEVKAEAISPEKNIPESSKAIVPSHKNGISICQMKKSDTIVNFNRFFSNVRSKALLPDRWSFNGIISDPTNSKKCFTCSEIDIRSDGLIYIKKCIQVYDDSSIRVLMDGEEVTEVLEVKKRVSNEFDVTETIGRVDNLKLCCGVKNFLPDDITHHPLAVLRGKGYYASDCYFILGYNYNTTICPSCNKLKNAVRRRRTRQKQERNKNLTKENVVMMSSRFGKELFGLLNQLTDEDEIKSTKKEKPKKRSKSNVPSSSASTTNFNVTQTNERIEERVDNKEDVGSSSSYMDVQSSSESMMPFQEFITIGGNGSLGSFILEPNSTEFTLADGQEYELIGEAEAGSEPIHLLDGNSNGIEIIEVDDQTMAQFSTHGSSMFYHSGGIQVSEIDSSDPNVFKVLGANGEIYYQQELVHVEDEIEEEN